MLKAIFTWGILTLFSITAFCQDRSSPKCIDALDCKEQIALNYGYVFISNNKTMNNGYETYLYHSNAGDTLQFVYYTRHNQPSKLKRIVGHNFIIDKIYKNWYDSNNNFNISKNRYDENWRIELR